MDSKGETFGRGAHAAKILPPGEKSPRCKTKRGESSGKRCFSKGSPHMIFLKSRYFSSGIIYRSASFPEIDEIRLRY